MTGLRVDPVSIAVTPAPRLVDALRRLWACLDRRRRVQAAALLGLTVCASIVEIAAIAMTLPFLGALTAPDRFAAHPAVAPVLAMAGLSERAEITVAVTAVFAVLALLAGAARIGLIVASTRFSYAVGADLGLSIFRRTLHQPYPVHVARHSSEVIAAISTKADTMVCDVIVPCMMIVTSLVLVSATMSVLIAFDPFTATAAFGGFACLYGVIAWSTRRRLASDGERVAAGSGRRVKVLQEALGGIRDVLIDGTQRHHVARYRDADRRLRRAQASSHVIARSPRFALEASGMVLIAIIAGLLADDAHGLSGAIPVLGTLALAAQRLLPLLQDGYWAVTTLNSARASLHDSLTLLEAPLPADADAPPPAPLPFEHHITLEGVAFRYRDDTRWVLDAVDLTIARGERIGFVGASGSGKSTVLDLVMGLIHPTRGTLRVDDTVIDAASARAWQARIAHVPQSIHLIDGSIEENIALGLPTEAIDVDRVRDAARRARIAQTVEAMPDGYRTQVGERGARLSGGQRQRIGIARALYKRADVLVLDEATSALDADTERAVMDTIDALGAQITVLVVAHRRDTLRGCGRIVTVREDGTLRIVAGGGGDGP